VVRAHQHSAGAQNGQSGAIGRSRGGLSTKLHVAVTPQWYLLNWHITAGQAADGASAPPLLQGLGNEIRQVVADRAYDSNVILQHIVARRCEPVIPARRNRRMGRPLSRTYYGMRGWVANFFARLKHFRRIATRYDKQVEMWDGEFTLASIGMAAGVRLHACIH
jgi:transposase